MKERVRELLFGVLTSQAPSPCLPPLCPLPTLPDHQAPCHEALGLVDKGQRATGQWVASKTLWVLVRVGSSWLLRQTE